MLGLEQSLVESDHTLTSLPSHILLKQPFHHQASRLQSEYLRCLCWLLGAPPHSDNQESNDTKMHNRRFYHVAGFLNIKHAVDRKKKQHGISDHTKCFYIFLVFCCNQRCEMATYFRLLNI